MTDQRTVRRRRPGPSGNSSRTQEQWVPQAESDERLEEILGDLGALLRQYEQDTSFLRATMDRAIHEALRVRGWKKNRISKITGISGSGSASGVDRAAKRHTASMQDGA